MPLADVTDRSAVLEAIAEADAMGREAFLKKYGLRYARHYFLLHNGERYDSKAIVGAARRFQSPQLGPMSPTEFTGGERTVARRLGELGFEVEDARLATGPTFVVGTHYKRLQLHKRWGGQWQNGCRHRSPRVPLSA